MALIELFSFNLSIKLAAKKIIIPAVVPISIEFVGDI